MLAQLTVLLALGVLCSPAPTCTSLHCTIIKEVLSDAKNNRLTIAGSSLIPMNIKDETCMRYNLNIFMGSLKANRTKNEEVIHQLNIVYNCEQLFPNVPSPQVPDKECKTAEVSRGVFMGQFKTFLGILYEKLHHPREKLQCT